MNSCSNPTQTNMLSRSFACRIWRKQGTNFFSKFASLCVCILFSFFSNSFYFFYNLPLHHPVVISSAAKVESSAPVVNPSLVSELLELAIRRKDAVVPTFGGLFLSWTAWVCHSARVFFLFGCLYLHHRHGARPTWVQPSLGVTPAPATPQLCPPPPPAHPHRHHHHHHHPILFASICRSFSPFSFLTRTRLLSVSLSHSPRHLTTCLVWEKISNM